MRFSALRSGVVVIASAVVVGGWASPAGGPPANDPTGLGAGRPGIGRLPTPNQPELEIGPIEGLTTAWHPAPTGTAIPSGTTLLFRTRAAPAAAVTWSGAIEISRDATWSTAICSLALPGVEAVLVTVSSGGSELSDGCRLDVVAIGLHDITVSPISVSLDPLEIDETWPPEELNQITMAYFFGDSIAEIRPVGEGLYRTSIDRFIPMQVEVDPPGFAPLMEWRVDGAAANAKLLGESAELALDEIGLHTISVGPLAAEQTVDVETYRVIITSHVSGEDIIPEGEPVVFTAVTNPPGYENDIAWLSSTKYGTAYPVLGEGSVFVAEFNDTWGELPDGTPWQWLGVKADNAVFNQDQKLFVGNFADGFIEPAIYEPISDATLTESDGQLIVTPAPGASDCGVRINNPLPMPAPVSSTNLVEAWRYNIDFIPTFAQPDSGMMTLTTRSTDDKVVNITTYDNVTDIIYLSEGDRFGGIVTIPASEFQPNALVKQEKKHRCRFLVFWRSRNCAFFLIFGHWKFGAFGDAPIDSTLNDLPLEAIDLVSTEGFAVSRLEIRSGDEVGGVEPWTILPSHARTTGGETITIEGEGLESLGEFILLVGDTEVTATVVDDSTMTFVSPPMPRGLTEVRILTEEGVDVILDNDFRYYATPKPLILDPNNLDDLPIGFLGAPYSGQITATGGIPPYTFQQASGNLPPGISLAPDGTVGGIPTEAGVFVFFVHLTDSSGEEDVRTFFLEVQQAASH